MTEPVPPSQLTAHLGYWLRYVSNHVSQAFARKVEREGVTVAEWVVLRELYDAGEISPSRLAERLGLTRGAISKLAERLLAKALIARRDDPDDARAQRLALTESGRALTPRLSALADQNDAEFFDHLTEAERRTVEQVMRQVVERRGLKAPPVS
ncbi:MarR family winged helix-turn-helix transcriptional regulator [Phenylobacterium conjunctum]|uniref:MarR family winged helix-turn-helix transcriptional regulator n=1 Tax=Phenylobacterium conjunctum TaxID=1298959 RepID=A0ABW3T8T7_9CAUL